MKAKQRKLYTWIFVIISCQMKFQSTCSSGIAEPDMTEIDKLLTDITNLQDTGPDDQVNSVYARGDKAEAEAVRSKATLAIHASQDSDDDFIDPSTLHANPAAPNGSNPNDVVIVVQATSDTHSDDLMIVSQKNNSNDDSNEDPVVVIASQANDSNDDCTIIGDLIEVSGSNSCPCSCDQATTGRNSNVAITNATTSTSSGSNTFNINRQKEDATKLKIFFTGENEELHEDEHRGDPSEKMITKSSGR